MIKFNKRYYGVEFDIELKDKICLFTGYSGTGKSFAMMAIHWTIVKKVDRELEGVKSFSRIGQAIKGY